MKFDLICRLCLGDGAREIFTLLLRGAASVPVELRLLDFERCDAVGKNAQKISHRASECHKRHV